MSYSERSERSGRQGQRRKHQRWGGSDRFHNDRAQVFQQYDGLKPSCSRAGEGRQLGHTAVLDELTLEHMTQDCNSLKNELLRLKTLLQLDESDSKVDDSEETEDKKTASQTEELMKEVQVLKEELSGRDETIARLTLQCQQLQQQQSAAATHHVTCQCHQQRAPSLLRPSDRRMQRHYDKATQTYWRPHSHAHQVLQFSSPCLSEQHLLLERTVKTPIEGHSDVTRTGSEGGAAVNGLTAGVSVPAFTDRGSLLSSHFLPRSSGAPLAVNPGDGPVSVAQSAAQREVRAPAVMLPNAAPPVSAAAAALTCPRLLQPPRLHKRVSLPSLKPGGAGSFGPLQTQTKQLPPPSRGLPCYNSGPQHPGPQRPSLLQPRRDLRSTNPGLEEPEEEMLTESGPTSLSRSCLLKPKIP